ncbi:hypothetical protein BN59_01623 [Legionella massiliensis]|uniref:Outer membrane protein beta-barrel domain-containing protein n=1 Tax=Legionella massiliensis TaxID=1034943 RepID=A0A078KSA7_9GAMM|nr:hypothetical protein [Legionella massiliensis]CDZ77340.1 hypothetical protein BN59_01623 [Legionella massiliensis]CEE13078.1 hypothetical protein BN1094_01623 [Legionella massiliensis]
MFFNKNKCWQFLLFVLTGIHASIALPNPNFLSSLPSSLKQGHVIIQFGGYWSSQGQAQHINIQDLVGDEFTLTKHKRSNGLVGLGYFLDGQETSFFRMSYGINAFYLAKTGVVGDVIQENLFTNLSYHYNLRHYPVYAIAKSTIKTKFPKYALTLDAGIGPNFIKADGFKEHSLDGITIPDNIFSSHSSTTFSATAGFGVRINQVFGQAPLECGYRFFYLGQGSFNKANNQVLNRLKTGSNYANAIICSMII